MDPVNLLIVVLLLGVMLWAVLAQRKGMSRQKDAIEQQRDAIEGQKYAITLAEESLAISRKQIENQERIISLLEDIKSNTHASG